MSHPPRLVGGRVGEGIWTGQLSDSLLQGHNQISTTQLLIKCGTGQKNSPYKANALPKEHAAGGAWDEGQPSPSNHNQLGRVGHNSDKCIAM